MSCKGGIAYILSPRLQGSAKTVSPRLQGSAITVSESLMGTARLVRCENGTYYLRVTPPVVWLSGDAVGSAVFDVKSNTNWRIE